MRSISREYPGRSTACSLTCDLDADVASIRDDAPMGTRNWLWGLGALVVWAAIFFAFLLIAIPRH